MANMSTRFERCTSHEYSLNLADMAPGDVTLMSPDDAASDVSRLPTFEWMAAGQAASYHLEVATDMDFTDVVINVTIKEDKRI